MNTISPINSTIIAHAPGSAAAHAETREHVPGATTPRDLRTERENA